VGWGKSGADPPTGGLISGMDKTRLKIATPKFNAPFDCFALRERRVDE
jgi:hypothetical protein